MQFSQSSSAVRGQQLNFFLSFPPLIIGKIACFTVKQSFGRLNTHVERWRKMSPMYVTLKAGVIEISLVYFAPVPGAILQSLSGPLLCRCAHRRWPCRSRWHCKLKANINQLTRLKCQSGINNWCSFRKRVRNNARKTINHIWWSIKSFVTVVYDSIDDLKDVRAKIL